MQNAFTICHLQKSVIVHGANNIQTFRAKYVDQKDDHWKVSYKSCVCGINLDGFLTTFLKTVLLFGCNFFEHPTSEYQTNSVL